MVDKIEKSLRKLNRKEQAVLRALLLRIKSGNLIGLDLKKLSGRDDVYRIRKGSLRIIFRHVNENIFILAVERRSETTYDI